MRGLSGTVRCCWPRLWVAQALGSLGAWLFPNRWSGVSYARIAMMRECKGRAFRSPEWDHSEASINVLTLARVKERGKAWATFQAQRSQLAMRGIKVRGRDMCQVLQSMRRWRMPTLMAMWAHIAWPLQPT